MPGLESDRGTGIQVSPIASIGEGPLTPAVGDFMKAFQSGFITVEDILKRTKDRPLEDAQREAKSALLPGEVENALAEQQTQRELRPVTQSIARKQLDLANKNLDTVATIKPLLDAAGVIQAEETLKDAKSHGNMNAMIALHRETQGKTFGKPVPIDPETGEVDMKAAEIDIKQALEYNRQQLQNLKALGEMKPLVKSVKDRTGKLTETTEFISPVSGISTSPIVTKTEEPSDSEVAKARSAAEDNVLAERHRSGVLKTFEPQIEAFSKLDEIRNSGRAPNNADDLGTLYLFVRILDPTSAVREGEAKLAASTVPGVQQLYNQFQSIFSDKNKVFDDRSRANIYGTIDSLKKGAEINIRPELARLAEIATSRDIPLKRVFSEPEMALLFRGSTASSAVAPAPGAATSQLKTTTEKPKVSVLYRNGFSYELQPDGTYK